MCQNWVQKLRTSKLSLFQSVIIKKDCKHFSIQVNLAGNQTENSTIITKTMLRIYSEADWNFLEGLNFLIEIMFLFSTML